MESPRDSKLRLDIRLYMVPGQKILQDHVFPFISISFQKSSCLKRWSTYCRSSSTYVFSKKGRLHFSDLNSQRHLRFALCTHWQQRANLLAWHKYLLPVETHSKMYQPLYLPINISNTKSTSIIRRAILFSQLRRIQMEIIYLALEPTKSLMYWRY